MHSDVLTSVALLTLKRLPFSGWPSSSRVNNSLRHIPTISLSGSHSGPLSPCPNPSRLRCQTARERPYTLELAGGIQMDSPSLYTLPHRFLPRGTIIKSLALISPLFPLSDHLELPHLAPPQWHSMSPLLATVSNKLSFWWQSSLHLLASPYLNNDKAHL